jgi:acyl-homoserine lactone acylase PvdQ
VIQLALIALAAAAAAAPGGGARREPGAAVQEPLEPPGPEAARARATAGAISAEHLETAAAAEREPGRAALYRDEWGVPHVVAAREADGFFALGYAQAEDQLARFLGFVRWFRGERAATEGPSALGWDGFQRLWRHRQEAEVGWERLSPQVQANYRAFIAGMERFMAEHPDAVPADAIDLEPVDLVLLPRAVSFLAYSGVEGMADCVRGGVEIAEDLRLPGPRTAAGAAAGGVAGEPAAAASNGWAVMPRRTADGATIVLADPHVEIDSPAYWEYRIHAGELHSAGFMMGALPWQAHTRDVAWAMTTGGPDVADCWEIEVDPADPRRYRYDGEWLQMEVERATIEVAGAPPVERTFEYTHHGGVLSPVVARQGDRAWVVSVASMHDGGLLDEEIRRMNLARSTAEVREAMKLLGMFPQTLVVGDRAGSVLLLRAGKTPRRPTGAEEKPKRRSRRRKKQAVQRELDWTRPVPGSTSSSTWQGFHALDDHVQLVDPPSGFVLDHNSAPDTHPGLERAAVEHPRHLFHDEPGRLTWRGLRGREVLARADVLGWDEAVALAFDQEWPATKRWQEALRYARETLPEVARREPLATYLERLLDFDGEASADSHDALAFYLFRMGLWRAFEDAGLGAIDGPAWRTGELTPQLARVVLEHAGRAERAWSARGGAHAMLGDVFRVGRQGGFAIGGVTIDEPALPACGGRLSPFCDVTQRALDAGPADEHGRRRVVSGSQSLRLVQFTDPIRSFTVHPYGQSQDASSPHWDDQSRLHAERRLKPTYFDHADLLEHLESARGLDTAAGRVDAAREPQ